MKRVLLTGMSGTGKSAIIAALKASGHKAADLDSDEYSHWVAADPSDTLTPAEGKDWQWREDRVQQLLDNEDAGVLFVSGCAENMTVFIPRFDHIILLSAPAEVIVHRLQCRTGNDFGKQPHELEQVMALRQTVEPLLREIAHHEIDTSAPLEDIVSEVLRLVKK